VTLSTDEMEFDDSSVPYFSPSVQGWAFDVFLFVRPSQLNGRVCTNDFTIKAFEYGNVFNTVG